MGKILVPSIKVILLLLLNPLIKVDLCSEENLAGVNPLPVDCPLVLADLREVTSNLDGVIQEA